MRRSPTREGRPVRVGLSLALFVASLVSSSILDRPGTALVETTRVARSIAETGTFADPFASGPSGPTAHVAPVFPAAAAPLFKAFGNSPRTHALLYAAAAFSIAAQAALLPVVSRAAGLGTAPGLIAALIALCMAPTPTPQWEGNHVGLLLMLLTWAIARSLDHGRPRPELIALGFGFVILAYPIAALAAPIWLVVAHRRGRWTYRRLAIVGLIPVLVLAPWVARNALVLGGPTFVRDNLGIEMGVSFNDCTRLSLMGNIMSGCFERHHPNRSPDELARLRAQGELRYNAERLDGALDFIRGSPGRAGALTARRFFAYWFPSGVADPLDSLRRGAQVRRDLTVYGATLLSVFGLGMLWRRSVPIAAILTAWYALVPLPYFVIQYAARYRAPLLWVTFLLAGVAISAALEAWGRRRGATAGPPAARGAPSP